jgi:hypothetical protein
MPTISSVTMLYGKMDSINVTKFIDLKVEIILDCPGGLNAIA